MTDLNPIAINDIVKITKGCKALDIPKGVMANVTNITDFEGSVFVTLKFRNGFIAGKVKSVRVRHRNRLADAEIKGHNGDPTQNIAFQRYAK